MTDRSTARARPRGARSSRVEPLRHPRPVPRPRKPDIPDVPGRGGPARGRSGDPMTRTWRLSVYDLALGAQPVTVPGHGYRFVYAAGGPVEGRSAAGELK